MLLNMTIPHLFVYGSKQENSLVYKISIKSTYVYQSGYKLQLSFIKVARICGWTIRLCKMVGVNIVNQIICALNRRY